MSYKKLSGPQILSNLLPNDAKKLLKNRGFFELELLSNWEKIVGTSFNKLSYPTKIKTSNSSPARIRDSCPISAIIFYCTL